MGGPALRASVQLPEVAGDVAVEEGQDDDVRPEGAAGRRQVLPALVLGEAVQDLGDVRADANGLLGDHGYLRIGAHTSPGQVAGQVGGGRARARGALGGQGQGAAEGGVGRAGLAALVREEES